MRKIVLHSRVIINIYDSLKVFKKVEKQLPQLTALDLQYVSPELLKVRDLELAVPGECPQKIDVLFVLNLDYRDVPEWKGSHQDCKFRP